jgi:hypothetical protein
MSFQRGCMNRMSFEAGGQTASVCSRITIGNRRQTRANRPRLRSRVRGRRNNEHSGCGGRTENGPYRTRTLRRAKVGSSAPLASGCRTQFVVAIAFISLIAGIRNYFVVFRGSDFDGIRKSSDIVSVALLPVCTAGNRPGRAGIRECFRDTRKKTMLAPIRHPNLLPLPFPGFDPAMRGEVDAYSMRGFACALVPI